MIEDYVFDPVRFSGGGITHDIIVWPARASLTNVDSAHKAVTFHHTPGQTSEYLGLSCSSGFPAAIVDGQANQFVFQVENLDPSRYLFHPVSLYVSVDSDSATPMILQVLPPHPIEPGGSFEIDVTGYVFNQARFSGGGITHDIIVWPMTLHVTQIDSFQASVRYLDQAAISMNVASVTGLNFPIHPFQSYDLHLTAENVGPHSSSSNLLFYVQLDNHPPTMLGVKPGLVPTAQTSTLNLSSFKLGTYYSSIVGHPSFARRPHQLRFWATEAHEETWVTQALIQLPAEVEVAVPNPNISFFRPILPSPNPTTGSVLFSLELEEKTPVDPATV